MSGHYEVDEDYEDPYWDPSSKEDELRMQLQKLKVQEIPREDLQWVFLNGHCNLGIAVDKITEGLTANPTRYTHTQLVMRLATGMHQEYKILLVCVKLC